MTEEDRGKRGRTALLSGGWRGVGEYAMRVQWNGLSCSRSAVTARDGCDEGSEAQPQRRQRVIRIPILCRLSAPVWIHPLARSPSAVPFLALPCPAHLPSSPSVDFPSDSHPLRCLSRRRSNPPFASHFVSHCVPFAHCRLRTPQLLTQNPTSNHSSMTDTPLTAGGSSRTRALQMPAGSSTRPAGSPTRRRRFVKTLPQTVFAW